MVEIPWHLHTMTYHPALLAKVDQWLVDQKMTVTRMAIGERLFCQFETVEDQFAFKLRWF